MNLNLTVLPRAFPNGPRARRSPELGHKLIKELVEMVEEEREGG